LQNIIDIDGNTGYTGGLRSKKAIDLSGARGVKGFIPI
jgi:hypothetical protein